jgi:hypothetical protein
MEGKEKIKDYTEARKMEDTEELFGAKGAIRFFRVFRFPASVLPW